MKIVINRCHGGFGLSDEGFEEYLRRKGITFHKWYGSYLITTYTSIPKEEYLALQEKCSTAEDRNKLDEFYLSYYEIERNDPVLVSVVEDLGEAACGRFAELKIVDIPDDVKWTIVDYDGIEHVAEVHRTWS